MKVVVSRAGTVGFRIAPVQMMVVNKSSIHDDTAVRLQGARNHVGSTSGGAPVLRRAGSAFGIGFDDESGKVGDLRVNAICGLLPPSRDLVIERIERAHPARDDGAAQINRDR